MSAETTEVSPTDDRDSQRRTEPALPMRGRSGNESASLPYARLVADRITPMPRPHPIGLTWMALSILVGATPATDLPMPGIDASWITGINVAAAEHRRFGADIVYTFGPWGYLDFPLAVTGTQAVLGLLFAVAATVAAFVATYVCLRTRLRPKIAGPLAFAVAVGITPAVYSGGKLVVAAFLVAFLVLRGRAATPIGASWWAHGVWPAAYLAAVGGFLLQVKVFEGMAVLAGAGLVAVCVASWRRAAFGVAVAIMSVVGSFLTFWLAAGQRLGDVGAYMRGSVEISAGYQEAMGLEPSATKVGYLVGFALAVVVVVTALSQLRRRFHVATVGSVLLAFALLELGFKHGFSRHDLGHERSYFVYTGLALIALAMSVRTYRPIMVVGLLALSFAPAALTAYDPFVARTSWQIGLGRLLDGGAQRQEMIDRSKSIGITQYQVPPSIVAAVGTKPVQVDPWETTAAWSLSMNWHPVPVFQPYVAFTAYLDELNAKAIIEAPVDQVVLRTSMWAVDGRNPRWDTPRYLLALACNYEQIAADGAFTVLRHDHNRCGPVRSVGQRSVTAGVPVATPTVGPDEILVTRFSPATPGLLNWAVHAALKDWSPVLVRADGALFRIPEALTDGPLLTRFPARAGWQAPFDGLNYNEFVFNTDGTLIFETIPLSIG